MELYLFVRDTLGWTVTIAVIWPFNIPLAALAYKIRQGPNPVGMPKKELWLRSAGCSFVVMLVTLVMVAVDYVLAERVGFPAGVIHVIVFMAYVSAAAGIFMVFFAMEDFFQGLGMFVTYVYLPVLVLFLLNAMIGFWNPLLNYVGSWLKMPT